MECTAYFFFIKRQYVKNRRFEIQKYIKLFLKNTKPLIKKTKFKQKLIEIKRNSKSRLEYTQLSRKHTIRNKFTYLKLISN